jgi:hypothetical protein
MKPELGPPEIEERTYSGERLSWLLEWDHLAVRIASSRPLLGGLKDARYAWARVQDAYASDPRYAAVRESLTR